MVKVTVWNENRHEKQNPIASKIYPRGIHNEIAEFLTKSGFSVRTAT